MFENKNKQKYMEMFVISVFLLYDFLICIVSPKLHGKDIKGDLEDESLVLWARDGSLITQQMLLHQSGGGQGSTQAWNEEEAPWLHRVSLFVPQSGIKPQQVETRFSMLTSARPKLPTQTSILMEMWMHHALGNKGLKKRIHTPPGNQSLCVFKYVTTAHNRKNQEMMSIREKVDKHMKVNPQNGIVYPILENELEQHGNINSYR